MQTDRRMLAVLLAVAALFGVTFVFLMPPWQHYDEPTHFEYVALIARTGQVPQVQANEIDRDLRREIAISMRAHHFFDGMVFQPPLEEEGKPIWLGLTQIGNLPLYYQIAALPVGWLAGRSVELQLYAARLVSWGCFMLSILACWGVVAVLTPSGHFLRLLIPLALALLPGFADVMTAVNNDSLAICLASLFLWGAVYLIRTGFALLPFCGVLLAAVLAFWSKETAYPIYILLPLMCLLMVLRGRGSWLVWGAVALGVLLAGLYFIEVDDAATWYRSSSQSVATRAASAQAVLGEHVLQLSTAANRLPNWASGALFQPVPKTTYLQDRDNVYTLGTWAWSGGAPARVTLALGFGYARYSQTFELTPQPTFIAITGTMTAQQYYPFRILLLPEKTSTAAEDAPGQMVFFDGIVLAEGIYPLDSAPLWPDEAGVQGTWGGRSFENLARNASAEQAGPRVRSELDAVFARFWPDQTRLSLLITALLDWPGASPYFMGAARRLFFTFWGQFGWGHVPLLLKEVADRLLAVSTLSGFVLSAGWLLVLARRSAKGALSTWVSVGIFLAIALLPWAVAFLRSPIYLGLVLLYLPVARYGYPAIIPTILGLNLGACLLWDALDRRFARPWLFKSVLGIGLPLAFALYALASILAYYHF